PIVERVPKAMGTMEEGQGDEDEKVESYQRMRDEPLEELVAGCLEPSQGKGQTGQKEMDGEEECGNRPPGAEQEPQERRDPSHYLPPQQHKGHGPREHEPGRVGRAEEDPDRHAAAVPPGMVQGIARLRVHLVPHGRSSDLTQWVAPVSLYCWMAPAGSTCLGHTFVHSPTKVHCQMPSCSERIFRRSAAPWSRESMLYRWARAMAAGPMKLGSSPW